MSSQVSILDADVEAGLSVMQRVLAGCRPRDFCVRLWDGTELPAQGARPPRFTLVLNEPDAIRRMFLHPNARSMGEAFVSGAVDVEGDLLAAMSLADYLLNLRPGLVEKVRLTTRILRLHSGQGTPSGRQAFRSRAAAHSRVRTRKAVNYHYDQPEAFWRLWLDPRLVYSCACFESPDDDLAAAQLRKLDWVCRKLGLTPGEQFFDMGCGWGALVIHAAKAYGADAYGVTLSALQADHANRAIEAAGLGVQCAVEARDFRDVDHLGVYDKIASIGAIEHVGERGLWEFFERAFKLLRPGGLFLSQGITGCAVAPLPAGPSFMDRYVFPDTDFPSISRMLATAEQVGFEIRDVECLRDHYRLTLQRWLARLEAQAEAAIEATDEATVRTFRLYLAASAHQFEIGALSIFQSLLAKPARGECDVPLSRKAWYV